MRLSGMAGGLAGLLLLSGCSGVTEAQPDPRPGAAASVVDRLRVGLTEWEIGTPRVVLSAGTVTFRVTNAGTAPHDLVARGRLGTWATPLLDPGEQTRLVVEAAAGERLLLDCSVAGHHAAGMHTSLRVTREPGTAGGDRG